MNQMPSSKNPYILQFWWSFFKRSHHLLIDTDNSPRVYANEKSVDTKQRKPNDPEKEAKVSSSGGEAKERANVVYVSPKHARQVKKSLQQRGWLEKRYRMIKVERENVHNTGESNNDSVSKIAIAIPISAPSSEVIATFGELIVDHSEEELPLSTSQYASKSKQR